jgi:hypothetical protein
MAAAFADPDYRFTREQLAWMIERDRAARGDDPDEPGFRDLVWRAGFAAGYQARVDEENRASRDQIRRAVADRDRDWQPGDDVDGGRGLPDPDDLLPRPGDHPGGPVQAW